jgi:hypothetical protein
MSQTLEIVGPFLVRKWENMFTQFLETISQILYSKKTESLRQEEIFTKVVSKKMEKLFMDLSEYNPENFQYPGLSVI